MAADAFSPTLGYLQMGTGNDNNSWGINANNGVFQIFEDAIAGVLNVSLSGGTLDLSSPAPPAAASLARYAIMVLTGAPTSAQTILLPPVTKSWIINNESSRDVFVQTPGNAALGATIPTGTIKLVYTGGVTIFRADKDDVGKVEMFAGTSLPAGSLECDNSLQLRASFPELFAKIGTTWGNTDSTNFRLPPGTDTGRFPRSRKAGTDDVGTTYSNQLGSHQHTGSVSVTGSTSTNGNHNHAATSSDGGHVHAGGQAGSQNGVEDAGGGNFRSVSGPGGNIWYGGPSSTSTGFANITTNIANFGDHSHTITGSGSFTTAAAGGSETRPESTVYRFCIRY